MKTIEILSVQTIPSGFGHYKVIVTTMDSEKYTHTTSDMRACDDFHCDDFDEERKEAGRLALTEQTLRANEVEYDELVFV